jgi:hypothetical protein
MASSSRFDDILEAIGNLPLEDQDAIIAIIERRRIAQRRAELAKDIEDARREFDAGALRPATPDEIMKDAST